MKYMSLFALCGALALLTACGGKNGCGTSCCPTSGSSIVTESAVEVQADEVVVEERATVSVGSDKEDLQEDELVEVMANK